MKRNEILNRVREIFRDIFDDQTLEISDTTNADDIDDWESLEQISILVAIQKEFSIKFSIEDIEGLMNVGQTLDLIERKLA